MAQPNPALTPPPSESSELLLDAAPWREVVQLLRQAARLAAERGSESEQFMQAAWAACLEARPGLREEIADKELRAQLKKLRKRGLVGIA
jgi:hypothetical protein